MNADARSASLVEIEHDAYGVPGVVLLTMNRPDASTRSPKRCSTRCRPR